MENDHREAAETAKKLMDIYAKSRDDAQAFIDKGGKGFFLVAAEGYMLLARGHDEYRLVTLFSGFALFASMSEAERIQKRWNDYVQAMHGEKGANMLVSVQDAIATAQHIKEAAEENLIRFSEYLKRTDNDQ